MDPRDPFNTAMFVEQGAHGIGVLLNHLAANLPLMGDDDRDFVLGMKVSLETGGIIKPENTQRLAAIARGLNAAGHDVLGGGAIPPLSPRKVLQDFANNVHILQPHERAFANQVAKKLQQNEALEKQEIERLMKIYTEKGF